MKSLKKLYIKTMGCQMNEYDSNRIVDLLVTSFGLEKVTTAETADLLILNTCSVREKAAEKVFSDLGRWRILKQHRPEIMIGVGGCVASQEGTNILSRAPFVDLVFGPQTLHKLPMLIKKRIVEDKPQLDLAWEQIDKFDNLPAPSVEDPCAYLSIMEGCNKYCSFCIVPYTRGREISRNVKNILLEAKQLVAGGVKEITLLGQNVNAYRSEHNGRTIDLAILLQYLAEFPEIVRLRFMTSHPKELSSNLINAFQHIPKLANHLHLPIQSGSDLILHKMKRGYTVMEYLEKIDQLRAIKPNISISSDFIVGFPGETEQDFNKTLQVIEKVGFDNSYSFTYSNRPGTPAANYPDNVDLATKKYRLGIIQNLISKNAIKISQSMLGTTQKIIISKIVDPTKQILSGKTENNRNVVICGSIDLLGKLVEVIITQQCNSGLKGILQESMIHVE